MSWLNGEDFFPQAIFDKITDIRIHDPGRASRLARSRRQRKKITENGRLTILPADHPARRITRVGTNHLATANRRDYLMRIMRILAGNAVDGLIASMDILEELFIIHDWVVRANGPPLLDYKLIIASLNPEVFCDTRSVGNTFTGPAPKTCKDWHLDGAKIFLPINEETDTAETLAHCAQLVAELDSLSLVTFLNPLLVKNSQISQFNAYDLAQTVGIISALGRSHLWLLTPWCPEYKVVAHATTFPILLIDIEGDTFFFLQQVAETLKCYHNVRGAIVGRNILFPGNYDPLIVARAVDGIVHRDWHIDQVKQSLLDTEDPLEGLKWRKILKEMEAIARDRFFIYESV